MYIGQHVNESYATSKALAITDFSFILLLNQHCLITLTQIRPQASMINVQLGGIVSILVII